MARIPCIQRVGWGGKSVMNKDGEAVYEPNLIVFKELLASKDPIKYLGILIPCFELLYVFETFWSFVC